MTLGTVLLANLLKSQVVVEDGLGDLDICCNEVPGAVDGTQMNCCN
jgi:hypothetical protein